MNAPRTCGCCRFLCGGSRFFCLISPDVEVKTGSLPRECPRKHPDERTLTILQDHPDLDGYEAQREETVTTRWISADKELPQVHDEVYDEGWRESDVVLVWAYTPSTDGTYGLGQWIDNVNDPAECGWNGATSDDFTLDERWVKVTHWVPLPDPPRDAPLVE